MVSWWIVLNDVTLVALALLTGWYAFSTAKILKATREQSQAAVAQAEATKATLTHLLRTEMPEWVEAGGEGFSPERTGVRLRNVGGSPATSIGVSFKPGLPAEIRSPSVYFGTIRPNDTITVEFHAERLVSPKWEGWLAVDCLGRWAQPYHFELPLVVQRQDPPHRLLGFATTGAPRSSYPGLEESPQDTVRE